MVGGGKEKRHELGREVKRLKRKGIRRNKEVGGKETRALGNEKNLMQYTWRKN